MSEQSSGVSSPVASMITECTNSNFLSCDMIRFKSISRWFFLTHRKNVSYLVCILHSSPC